MDGVHPAMVELFDRLAQMRKWLLRAQELRDQGVDGLEQSPSHIKRILKGKNMQLFDEMNKAAGSPDINLASNVCKGFDLMGTIPSGGIFPCKYTHATLTPEQVRGMAKLSKQATWTATRKCKGQNLAAEVYKATCDECEKGWLRGPFQLQGLPEEAVLTRRFGIQQSATLGDGSRVYKTRPIDDFSESLVNSTNSCSETIQPMSIDMILAALAMRARKCGSEKLFGKAIDLRKAYKNLPLSESALDDAYICVFSPEANQPMAFQSQVLPFGARAAVMGFCRVSYALWLIGVALFNLHWTVFFDDFYLIASEQERRHIDLAQSVLFQLLGWEVSSEKGADFDAVARILGVQIDLSESDIGIFTVCNVDARVKELVATIDHILSQQTLSAAEMRVLRGRLVFAEAQIFGRIAGLHMQQLGRWEYAVGHSSIDPELVESLSFLRDRIVLGGPRRVNSDHGRTFHLYTDACLENGVGGIGGVLLDQYGKVLSFFSQVVTEHQVALLNPRHKETIIFELEALAVLVGCTNLLPAEGIMTNDRIVVFIDNNSVLSRLISGKCGSELDGKNFQHVLEWEYNTNSVCWYERVPSAANVADGPSRGDKSDLEMNLEILLEVSDVLHALSLASP